MFNDQDDKLGTIRAYYDQNTPRFLSYGEQRRTRTIHRPVWGEGVKNETQALHYVHNLILDDLQLIPWEFNNGVQVLDMGCGVGASLFYLANNLDGDFSGFGLTISPVQVKIALKEQLIKDPENKCKFILGDFLRPPMQMRFDLVYSIESFAHSVDPQAFFHAAAGLLKPGGRLVVCDDFLGRGAKGSTFKHRKVQWLKIFKNGWGINGLWEPSFVEGLAAKEGFILLKNDTLSPYLHLRPLPPLVIELLSAAVGALPNESLYLRSVMGGQALQLCLAHEIVEYRYLVFER